MPAHGEVAHRLAAAPPQVPAARPRPSAAPRSAAPGFPDDPALGEVELPNLPESAGRARRLARAAVRGRWGLSADVAEDTVLLVSELVGNAVRHTGAHVIGLRLLHPPGLVRIEVRDPSRSLPCLLPVGPLDTSGRGLFLVDHLASRWGVDPLPRGKTTWCELPAPAGS